MNIDELKQIPDRAYKVVRYEDGQAQSVYADLMYGEGYPVCKYVPGQITIAPTTVGIFCWEEEKAAIADARTDYHTLSAKAVLEVIPVGSPISNLRYHKGVQYPAVIPLCEVWHDDVEPVKEPGPWRDITRECRPLFQRKSDGGGYILLMYQGFEVCVFDGTAAIKEHINPREGRPEFRIDVQEGVSLGEAARGVSAAPVGRFRVWARN